MENIKVSVIVPVYNVEKYIEKTVNSLINQDYGNIEIILVDDGSADSSGTLLDAFAKADKRIKVIHQKNAGVSSARNAGINMALGEYIMFVDGDDWVDSDYVSYFVNLVLSDGCLIGMNTHNYYADFKGKSDKTYALNTEKAIEWIYMGKIFVAVWNKIYSAKLLKETGVRFNTEIWYGEGMLFNIEILQFCDKIAIGERCVYHQTPNPNSAMRNFNLESNFCGIRSLELQKKKWKKVNEHIEKAWNYHMYSFNRSILDGLVRSNKVEANKTVFEECKHNIIRNIKIPMTADISIKEKLSWIAYAIMPTLMAKRHAHNFKLTVKKWGGYSEQAAACQNWSLFSAECHKLNFYPSDFSCRWSENILCNISDSILGGVA